MHIAVFNQHHHSPDCPATCRHYTFLEYLANRHQVSLVTSSAWRQVQITAKYDWIPAGVKAYEQHVPYHNNMGVPQRFLSYGGYAAYGLAKGLSMPKPDVIWGVSTPLSTPWIAAQVARLRGVPWVFEVQDLWPSFPIEMGAIKNKILQRRLYALEKGLYQSASHIITLSPGMSAHIASLGIDQDKITTNLNGTDLDLLTQADEKAISAAYNLEGKQVILYAGSFGRANDIPNLLKAAIALASEPQVQVVFTGGGFYESEIKETAAKYHHITYLPPLPRHQIFSLFKIAALSLVSFNDLPVLASNSPSKFYDSLACGTPVIVTNPGWTKLFVEEYACGWYTPAEQPEALSGMIKKLLSRPEDMKQAGARGTAVAAKHFDRQKLAKQVEGILLQASKNK